MAMLLMVAGLIAAVIGSVMIIVAAFRKSVAWGLGSLFVPFVAYVFVFMNWSEAKNGFLWSIGGILLVFIGSAMSPGAEASVMNWAL